MKKTTIEVIIGIFLVVTLFDVIGGNILSNLDTTPDFDDKILVWNAVLLFSATFIIGVLRARRYESFHTEALTDLPLILLAFPLVAGFASLYNL